MNEQKIRELRKQLKYLVESEINKEIEIYFSHISEENIDIKKLADEIYLKRGIDISKINRGFISNLTNTVSEMIDLFKDRDKEIKNKMVIEIIYIIILLIFMKIPFDLVRDIGYEYIEILSNNQLYFSLWSLAFLLIYTVVIICAFVVLARNFNKKYKRTS